MGYKKEDAYQHALCMDLTPDKFQFSILNPKTKEILHFEEFQLEEFSKDSVKKYFDHAYFKLDFASFCLASGSNRNTLIPVSLFNHSNADSIFKLNYPDPIDNLDYNRLPDLGIVNIYELPLWIKSLFVIQFPRVKIIHRSTVLLKGIFDQPVFQPKMNLFVEDEQFYLMITDRSKLVYFNRFDYKTIADLVYYVLFVIEQKEFDQTKFEMNIFGVDENWLKSTKLQDFFKAKIQVNNNQSQSKNFILNKQLLCV